MKVIEITTCPNCGMVFSPREFLDNPAYRRDNEVVVKVHGGFVKIRGRLGLCPKCRGVQDGY